MLALTGMVGGTVMPVRGAAGQVPVPFAALDGGQAVVPHVLVTALTVASDGTIYAGGRYMVRDTTPYATPPVYPTGSVWLVSHDHGARWTQRVSTTNPRAFPRTGAAAWRNHQTLPLDFTPLAIAVDPRHPRVIYVAGCSDLAATCSQPLAGGHRLVRSTDGGRTWHDVLTNGTIARTPALQAALRHGPSRVSLPTEAFAVVVDPRNSARLYVAVDELGVLRSTTAGRTWIYVKQPQTGQVTRPCELLLDPHNSHTLYELNRAGALYRTSDAGTHWVMRDALSVQLGSTLASLTFVGRALYVTAAKGLYASADDGKHWRLAFPASQPGAFYQSVRGTAGWISAFGPSPKATGAAAGLYDQQDGRRWQLAADTAKRGPRGYGSLDFQAMDANLATRLWEDRTAHIVFTAGSLGGLYRWRSGV